MQKHIFYSISYQAWNKTKAVFAKAWLALAHWEVTGFDASLRQSNTPQDHNRPHPAPKEIPQKESSPIENAMQAFSNDFAIFIYLMAHTEGLVREISKEVLSQDCSYGKKLLFKACFLKHNSFKNFTCPYLTDIHFFIFTNKLCISITKKKWNQKELFCHRELDLKTKVQWHFHEFHLLAFSVSSWRGVRARWFMNIPPHQLLPPSPTCTEKGSLRASSAKPSHGAAPARTPCTAPSRSEETQLFSFASPTILLVTSLSVEG